MTRQCTTGLARTSCIPDERGGLVLGQGHWRVGPLSGRQLERELPINPAAISGDQRRSDSSEVVERES
eukprot:CAMPEP_0181196488 /NCGR_PEP_ID=MMETSP1096-20121128/15496_1 /TAXON_ID=156174 ORGANISM="Chrysochromulina ericina, Strain CCMP281" /NCGR_SAMPLE_ID=MMETSP1096 /ASSEMBLY_ACC=CAM_ASM_000453 /LENGTH=67 /DNA_ID=CAMNT_0023286259 /DNA_START=749 /DNA_END=952 /DNA_ORIENTATION=+